ncbi:putative Fe-S cluster [Candidatus Electrothrix marina]|uniref:Putative Fe-S cluster n=1 Tax=Candidatus Electrothrix marina TaxID=1859130 RepID=A0A3S3SRW4_9BACT|nr:putative Fe-S cluster [Candidatus Electrothrix marina]
MTPHEFLKYIPATNCGECGYAACLAFAVAVTKGGVAPGLCPYVQRDSLPAEFGAAKGESGLDRVERGQDERDMALVAHLKSKIQSLDFCQLSRRLGTAWSAENPDQLRFRYLGRLILLGRDEVVMDGQQLVDPRDQILLYNYVAFGGNASGNTGDGAEESLPNGTWVGMESLPNSIAKIRTLATYCEGRLAERFAGRIEELVPLCDKVGGERGNDEQGRSADFSAVLPVLPYVPLYLLFWDQDVEDGFEARVKILFDQHIMDFLDLESLVFAAERMADRLLELDRKQDREPGS